jgi:hypothetical protein
MPPPPITGKASVQKRVIALTANAVSAAHVTVMAVIAASVAVSEANAHSKARKTLLRLKYLSKISLQPIWNLRTTLRNQ